MTMSRPNHQLADIVNPTWKYIGYIKKIFEKKYYQAEEISLRQLNCPGAAAGASPELHGQL